MKKSRSEEAVTYTPKLNNRFTVKFDDSINIPSYVVESLTLPSWRCGGWEPMQFTLCDPVTPSTALTLCGVLQADDSDRERSVTIKHLGEKGEVVGSWLVEFNEIQSVEFGSVDYFSGQAIKIDVVILPDNCVYTAR